jgi:hypothetical protein
MEDSGRRPPYCSVASVEEFVKAIRTLGVPEVVDRRYLQRLRVARSNEWALLSALKFLGILDDRGRPTGAYRALQTSEWRTTLGELVLSAYHDLFAVGGADRTQQQLADYFALTSSASQARNAARFFRGILELTGLERRSTTANSTPARSEDPLDEALRPAPPAADSARITSPAVSPQSTTVERADTLLRLKGEVLSWMPQSREGWTPEQYREVLDGILEILRNLDATE